MPLGRVFAGELPPASPVARQLVIEANGLTMKHSTEVVDHECGQALGAGVEAKEQT